MAANIHELVTGDEVSDSFLVETMDNGGATDTDTITVTITGLNDTPIISGVLTSALTEDETDVTANITVTDLDEGATKTIDIFGGGGVYGNLSIDALTGIWTYTLDAVSHQLDEGATFTENFYIEVMDNEEAFTTETISIVITGVNDQPIVGGTIDKSGTEDDGVITANISIIDVDQSSTVNYTLVDSSGLYGSLSLDTTTGEWEYSMVDNLVTSLDAGDQLTDTFTVDVIDNLGATNNGIITITINGVNDAPVLSGVFTGSATEEIATITGNISTFDLDESATKNYEITNPVGSYGTLSIDANSDEWIYTIDAQLLDEGDSVTESFTVQVIDDQGGTDSDVITVTISGENDGPVISGTPIISADEDAAYSFIPTGVDVDNDDTLTYSIENMPHWAIFNSNTGELSGTPDKDDIGVSSDIKITVTDVLGESDSLASFNIEVLFVNDTPIISGTPNLSVDEDSSYSFVPSVSDEEGDAIIFGANNLPVWASIATENGAITGTPENDCGSQNMK